MGNDEENLVCEKNEDEEKVGGVMDEEVERSKADQERSQFVIDGTNSDERNGEEIKEKEKEMAEGTVVGQLRPERNSLEQNSNEREEANLAESAAKKKTEVASSARSRKNKKRRITRGQVMSLHKALG